MAFLFKFHSIISRLPARKQNKYSKILENAMEGNGGESGVVKSAAFRIKTHSCLSRNMKHDDRRFRQWKEDTRDRGEEE